MNVKFQTLRKQCGDSIHSASGNLSPLEAAHNTLPGINSDQAPTFMLGVSKD
jgi:hypothetical protein